MISKNHYINLANGRFDDTNPHDLDAAFASYDTTQSPSGWVIHFHGGLVPEQSALETAESLRSAYAEAGAYPFFFIWESGAWETFRNNLRDIAEEMLFKKVVSYLVEYLLDKLGINPGVLTAESNIPGERPQVEVENWMKRQEQADAAVSPRAPYDGIRNEEASKNLTGNEVDADEIEALMRADQELQHELNRLNAELRQTKVSSEATDSGLGYKTPGHLSPAALQELTGVNRQPGQTPQLHEALLGITLARVAIAAARIGYSVIRRYMKGRDHGLYTTVVEEVLRDLYVDQIGSTLFWNQMKRDTLDAFGDNENLYGGTAFVKRLAKQLATVTPAPRVTLVAHSAGAQFVCHFLLHAHRQLNPSVQFDVILLAPAVDFELMQQAIQTRRIANIRVFALTDEFEAKDALLAPLSNRLKYVYPKSLLYLVSGLLETEVDRPLVGMERYYLGQQYTGRMFAAVTAIRQYLIGSADRMVWTPTTSSAPGLTSKCTRHTDFNVGDPDTLSSVRHILTNGFAPGANLGSLESIQASEVSEPSLDVLVDQLSETEAIQALNGFSKWFKNQRDVKSQPKRSAKFLTSLSNSIPTADQETPLSDGELAKMTLKVAAKNEHCQQSLTKFVGSATKLKPLNDRIIVEPLESEAKTAGGIVLPDSAKEKPQRGKVIAVGPGRLLDSGDRQPLSVQIGDEVLFSKYGGTEIEFDDKDVKILSESDILATLDSPKSSPALTLDSVLVGLQSQMDIKDTASGFDVSVQQPSYELSRSVGEYVSRGQKKKKTPDSTAKSSELRINESRVIAALAELPAQDLEAVYSRCWKGKPQKITANSVPQHAKLLVDDALSQGADLEDLVVNANLAVPSAGLLQQFIPTYQRVSHGLRHRLMASPVFQSESIEAPKSPAAIPMTLRLRSPKVSLENVPGLKVISRMGTIVVARGTAESVAALEQNDDVLAIDGPSSSAMPECIRSMTHIHADVAKSKSEEAGENCLVAVIDGGIDIFHEAFRKAQDLRKTRLIGVWDLTDSSGPPPAGQVIGTWHSIDQIEGYLAANAPGKNLTRDPVGHGTHVTSIAAGTCPADPAKRAEFPGGVAHEAPILAIIVGDSQYEDDAPSHLGYSETHVTALSFIHQIAKDLQLPVVVNISQGEQAGGHDGTTLLEAAIDQFCEVGRAPGRVVVKSSGNNRADMGHAYLTMSAGSQEDLDWNSAVQKQWPKGRFKDVIEIWFNTSKRMAFQLISPDAHTSDPANLANQNPQGTFPNGNTYRMQYSERFRDNGHGRLRIEITNGTANAIQDGKWQLEIVNGDPLKPQEIHAWVERTDWQPVSFTNFPSVDITLTVPGTANSVITVAAVETAAHVRVAKFSGYGGTRTGVRKPEISAPGVGIVAAQSGTTFGFVPKSGTSMAAPHVTGAIALLMSACHKRRATTSVPSANEIREAFSQLNVANVWDRGAGYGVLDIDKLLDHFGPFSPADLTVTPPQLIAAAQPIPPTPAVAPAPAGGQS